LREQKETSVGRMEGRGRVHVESIRAASLIWKFAPLNRRRNLWGTNDARDYCEVKRGEQAFLKTVTRLESPRRRKKLEEATHSTKQILGLYVVNDH